jgi:hypothetical protein
MAARRLQDRDKERMRSSLTPEKLNLIKLYLEKHPTNSTSERANLFEEIHALLEDNRILRETLFQMQQQVPPEQQWQQILAAQLQRAVQENGKQDALEITSSTPEAEGVWVISIQRKHGKTPEQRYQDAEARRLKAVSKVTNLIGANRDLRQKLAKQTKELNACAFLKRTFLTEDEEVKTRQEIELMIDFVNKQVSQFNAAFYRHKVVTLTPSVQGMIGEAWSRAYIADMKSALLIRENQKLKAKINAKRINKMRFGKYRKSK